MDDVSSITFEVDLSRRLRTTIAVGRITDEIIFKAYDTLVSDPAYDPTLKELLDLTGVERLEITSEGVRQLIKMFARGDLLAPNKVAMVATRDHVFAMGRMYQMLSQKSDLIMVFREMKPALKWLEIDFDNG